MFFILLRDKYGRMLKEQIRVSCYTNRVKIWNSLSIPNYVYLQSIDNESFDSLRLTLPFVQLGVAII